VIIMIKKFPFAIFLLFCFLVLYSVTYASDLRYPIAKQHEQFGYGFIDEKGNEIIESKYIFATDFSEGLALVLEAADPYITKVIDGNGNVVNTFNAKFSDNPDEEKPNYVIPPEIYFYDVFYNGQYGIQYQNIFNQGVLVALNSKGKCGYVDKMGNWIFKNTYDLCFPFSEYATLVGVRVQAIEYNMDQYKYFYIDKNGRPIVKQTFDLANVFKEGLGVVGNYDPQSKSWDDRQYFQILNVKGEFINNKKYKNILKILNGVVAVETQKGIEYIDAKGKNIKKEIYRKISSPNPGFTYELKEQILKIFDSKNKKIFEGQFDNGNEYSEGLAAVNKGGKFEESENPDGPSVTYFTGGKWGFIDSTGKQVIDFKYDAVQPFKNGLARVKDFEKWGKELWAYIDKTGKIVWEPK